MAVRRWRERIAIEISNMSGDMKIRVSIIETLMLTVSVEDAGRNKLGVTLRITAARRRYTSSTTGIITLTLGGGLLASMKSVEFM
jgi:hypothetical protein